MQPGLSVLHGNNQYNSQQVNNVLFTMSSSIDVNTLNTSVKTRDQVSRAIKTCDQVSQAIIPNIYNTDVSSALGSIISKPLHAKQLHNMFAELNEDLEIPDCDNEVEFPGL